MDSKSERLLALALNDAVENDFELQYWWLSFADSSRPTGQQFLGVTVVKACGMALAVMRSHSLKINPGGEVRGVVIPAHVPPPAELTDQQHLFYLERQWAKANREASS